MSDYSVGNRVQVRSHGQMYPAKVNRVHDDGKVDVQYEADGTVGSMLTVDV